MHCTYDDIKMLTVDKNGLLRKYEYHSSEMSEKNHNKRRISTRQRLTVSEGLIRAREDSLTMQQILDHAFGNWDSEGPEVVRYSGKYTDSYGPLPLGERLTEESLSALKKYLV